MKTKSFFMFFFSVVATSLFIIVFHSQKSDSIQTMVSQTHQHIKNFQVNLKEVEENHLLEEDKYFDVLGLNNRSPVESWHNTSVPVIVSYVLDGQHAQAIGFVRNILTKLPTYTILLYNLGLSRYSFEAVANYCNSSKCVIFDFDLSQFPSHVNDERLHAFRPLIIQHALSRVGGVVFIETNHRFKGIASQVASLYTLAEKESGIIAWSRRPAVSSLTHPKMFGYFHTDADSFLFLPMVDVVKLIVVQSTHISDRVMRPWVQCALTHDCIFPIGAQSGGCRFDKKPQYRYSGCHSYDASALNIVLGLRYHLDESYYTYKGKEDLFIKLSDEELSQEYRLLEKNVTSGPIEVTVSVDSVNYKSEQSDDIQ